MTVSILPSIPKTREETRAALNQYYQDFKNKTPWTNPNMTREQYRLSLENRLEEFDRELAAAY